MSELNSNTTDGLEQTVVMLEQILEVMPDDLFTLRALYETSVKLEHPEKAFETLTRLDDQARAAQNEEMIDFVMNQYATIADDSHEVQGRIDRLQEIKNVLLLMSEDAADAEASSSASQPGDNGVAARMEAEMALAWDLFQEEQLTQEEYSSVLHDLTEMSSHTIEVPVTVLHVLHDRQFSRIERLMTYLCQTNDTPIMVLSQYEENEEVGRMIPIEFSSTNGLLPFAKVGEDLLVAVLNPKDKGLLAEAEALCGHRCHPYLVTPDEYDRQLQKVRQSIEDLV